MKHYAVTLRYKEYTSATTKVRRTVTHYVNADSYTSALSMVEELPFSGGHVYSVTISERGLAK